MKRAVRAPHEYVKARAAPGASDRSATAWRARDIQPIDPAFSVPPAVAEHAVGADREHVDAVRIARGGGRLPGECATEGFPAVPARAVPVAIPDLAVLVDGEDLGLAGVTPRRGGASGAERAAQR